MKANQKFMEADNAVSPVIGVILMVAITVVLAAVVFVLVSDLGGGGGETQPAISWSVSQSAGTATVTAADSGANWDEFALRCVPDCSVTHPGGTDTGASAFGDPLKSASIGGGDVLDFCVAGQSSSAAMTATLRHIDSNAVAREFSFSSLKGCGP